MAKMIKFTAELQVVPFPRPSTKGKRRYNPKRYTDFKNALGYIALGEMRGREMIKGAFKISAVFYKKSRYKVTDQKFGDTDNFVKSVLDALQGICYKNDSQCVDFGRLKKIKSENPRIIIELEEVEENDYVEN